MSNQVRSKSNPTAMPVIAGIIAIVVGAGALLGLSVLGVLALFLPNFGIPFILFPLLGLPFLAIGVVAIVGGIYATQRRQWGWALAGSICAAIISNVVGIAAIVLIAVSKGEFADA